MKLEVLVADDHAIIRDGLTKILADTADLVVAGEASNGVAVMEKVRARLEPAGARHLHAGTQRARTRQAGEGRTA